MGPYPLLGPLREACGGREAAGKTAHSQDPPPTWTLHFCPNMELETPRASSNCALRLTWDRKLPPTGVGRREASVCRVTSVSLALVSGKGPEEPGGGGRCRDRCSSPQSGRDSSGEISQPLSQVGAVDAAPSIWLPCPPHPSLAAPWAQPGMKCLTHRCWVPTGSWPGSPDP